MDTIIRRDNLKWFIFCYSCVSALYVKRSYMVFSLLTHHYIIILCCKVYNVIGGGCIGGNIWRYQFFQKLWVTILFFNLEIKTDIIFNLSVHFHFLIFSISSSDIFISQCFCVSLNISVNSKLIFLIIFSCLSI